MIISDYQKVVFDTDSVHNMHSPYENLAVAVLVTALRDYQRCLEQDVQRPTSKNNIKIRELKRFFASDDLEIYTKSNGAEVRKLVKKLEVEHEFMHQKRRQGED